jgi:uncharacterized protein YqhQ
MSVNYQKICEDRYIVDRDPANGRSLRNIDMVSLKLAVALLLSSSIFLVLLYTYFYFFVAPTMLNGLGNGFVGLLRKINLK